jgi:hypothetical protein
MTFIPGPYKRHSQSPIQLDTVLVVEGRDCFEFVIALLTDIGLQQRIDVRDGGGVAKGASGDLAKYLQLLPAVSGFDKVAALGILCDAEVNPAKTFQDTCRALVRARLTAPQTCLQATTSVPKVTVMLLPDAASPGMLETLCWRSVAGSPIVPCVEDYLNCLNAKTGRQVRVPDKSRVDAFVAAQDDPWLLLGQAARAGLFPWTSPAFDEIKAFLYGLIASTP